MTVKEICEKTGLNRKLLFDYADVIEPCGHRTVGYVTREGKSIDGHKEYDEEALVRFQQVAIYRQLGMSRSEIKKKMGEGYDCNGIIEEQLKELRKKLIEIEELIAVAEQMKRIGIRNEVSLLFSRELRQEMSSITKRVRKMKCFEKMAREIGTTKDKFSGKADNICQCFIENIGKDNAVLANKAMELFAVAKEHYGLIGIFVIAGAFVSVLGGGDYGNEIRKKFGTKKARILAKVYLKYVDKVFDGFYSELIDLMMENEGCVGKEYAAPEVQELIVSIRKLCEEYFLIHEKEEYELLFGLNDNKYYIDGYDMWNYAISAFKADIEEGKNASNK